MGQAGTNDIFIAKLNNAGVILWAKSAGGENDDLANSIAVDKNKNVYIAGDFGSPKIIFQSRDTIINKGDHTGSSSDIFFSKFNTDGNLIWAKSIAGTQNAYDHAYGITVDSKNNVYLTGGTYSKELYFDSLSISNAGINNTKADSIRISKAISMLMDSLGNLKDTSGFKSKRNSTDRLVKVLPNERPFRIFEKIFISKYSPSGKIIWAEIVGGGDDEEGEAIAVDANDNIFITGRFQSSSITLDSTTMNNNGSNDIFIAKYNSDGKSLWAKSIGGPADDRGKSINTDSYGNVYITGWFRSSKVEFGKCLLVNSGSKYFTDMFIAKYNNEGAALWSENPKGIDNDWGNGLVVDNAGNIYIIGGSDSSVLNFSNTKLSNSDKGIGKSFFISKINAK